MKIIDAIQKSAHKYNTPDDRYGYGIPNMKTAFGILLADFATSSASITNCQTTINWTSKDLAMMRYEIERKLPGENSYTKIADVNGQGNNLAVYNYQHTDALTNANPGTVWYRIKQIIDTAAATLTGVYIDSASANLTNTCLGSGVNDPNVAENKITVYPNPINKTLQLSVDTKNAVSKLVFSVYDINGKLVYQLQQSKAAGKVNFNLPATHLSKGEYIIAVFDDRKKIISARFLKL
jgi:serine protease AprX